MINKKHDKINFQSLRDKLVTNSTKKHSSIYENIVYKRKTITKMISDLKILEDNVKKSSIKNSSISDNIINLNKMLKKNKKRLSTIEAVKNDAINDWELNTPKEIRAEAINDVCKAYKTGFTNLKNGNVKFFNVNYRKKKNNTSIVIPKTFIKYENNSLILAPTFLEKNSKLKIGRKTRKKLQDSFTIEHDSRIIRKQNDYWLLVPIKTSTSDKIKPINYCGIDPGCKTFMTTFGNNNFIEYKQNKILIDNINKKLKFFKQQRENKGLMSVKRKKYRRRYRKPALTKIEKTKSNLIDELHWSTITDIVKENDVIFYGDIKSHDIVKRNKNKTLNRDMNDLKFYLFKLRLTFKAEERNKKIFNVNESYTTLTCSSCGNVYDVKTAKIYKCQNKECSHNGHVIDRDMNAAKNILMKGIMKNL
jgi:putative transposase